MRMNNKEIWRTIPSVGRAVWNAVSDSMVYFIWFQHTIAFFSRLKYPFSSVPKPGNHFLLFWPRKIATRAARWRAIFATLDCWMTTTYPPRSLRVWAHRSTSTADDDVRGPGKGHTVQKEWRESTEKKEVEWNWWLNYLMHSSLRTFTKGCWVSFRPYLICL